MTFPQGFYAQYGSPQSFYGNIQYGRIEPYKQPYGAWPEERPKQEGMLYGDWQDDEEVIVPEVIDTSAEIAANVEIIRSLRAQLAATEDTLSRQTIRNQIDTAREAKIKAFKLAAQIDEEETTFLLLH